MDAMAWLLLPMIGGIAVAAWALRKKTRGDTHCPSCNVELELVSSAGDGPNHTYDVLACPMCANTATRVNNRRANLAFCPACRGHSLEIPCMRLPGDGLRIEVHEHCGVCDFERTFVLGERTPLPMGKVIPFPVDRVRARRRTPEVVEPEVQGKSEGGGSS